MNQDLEMVCRSLANAHLDIHRFMMFELLPNAERDSLIFRCHHNSQELIKFARKTEGEYPPLKTYKLNSSSE